MKSRERALCTDPAAGVGSVNERAAEPGPVTAEPFEPPTVTPLGNVLDLLASACAGSDDGQ